MAEGFGASPAIQPVGLILSSVDPVALDTVAAYAIGYDRLPMWTTFYAEKFGLGCGDADGIQLRGADWNEFPLRRLAFPLMPPEKERWADRMTRVVNNTVLRQRPVIDQSLCNGCGECAGRCPAKCIRPHRECGYSIDRARCSDCECCIKVCPTAAVRLDFVGAVGSLRRLVPSAAKAGVA
jgi:ferredoxin